KDFGLLNVFLINDIAGPVVWGERWMYWFIESLIQILVVLAIAFCIPIVRLRQRDHAYPLALVLLAGTLVLRYANTIHWHDSTRLGAAEAQHYNTPQLVAWLFAIGWVAYLSTDVRRKLLLTAIAVATLPSFGAGIYHTEV